jgi:hypothetical protein
MKLPFIIASQEKEKGLEQWNKIFVKNGRNIHEGVWRRTQDKKNAEFSQWKNEDDKRLRVVHFVDHYSVISGEDGSSCCLALIGAYLRINHTLPISEAKSVFKRYRESVKIKNLEIVDENDYTKIFKFITNDDKVYYSNDYFIVPEEEVIRISKEDFNNDIKKTLKNLFLTNKGYSDMEDIKHIHVNQF